MTSNRPIASLALPAILLAAAIARPAEAALVRLKRAATVSQAVVTLADVADVADADPDEMRRLGEITLCPAPAPGGETQIEFATIRSRLQAHGVDLARIEFSGSSAVTVAATAAETPRPARPAAAVITASAAAAASPDVTDWQFRRAESLVSDAVRQHLAAHTPRLGEVNVEVRLNRDDVTRLLAHAASGLEARGGNPPWDAWQSFAIVVRENSARPSAAQADPPEFEVRCRISPKPFVVAAKYALPRGHIIRPEDLVLRQTDENRGGVARPEDAVGRETTRAVRAAEPIDPAAIQTVPLIRSNDIVTVYARQPSVTVKRLMKARGDGAAGDAVTVVTLDGREEISARVTGYHEAEVVGSTPAQSPVRFLPAGEPSQGGGR
jgi:flagella basal body P-ring formation protein FlgA